MKREDVKREVVLPGHHSRITYHVSRITYHVSRITYHVSRITYRSESMFTTRNPVEPFLFEVKAR